MRMPAHYYHNLYEDNPTTGTTVYVHYYNPDTTSTNTYANLRVKSGSTFKTFVFGGDGNCSWEGHILASGGYLKSTANGNTITIGSQNTSWCHFENSANIPFWFSNTIQMAQGKIIGGPSTQYRPFQLYLGRYTTSGSNALNAGNPLIEFSNADRSQYCQLIYDDYDSLCAPDSLTLVGNQNGINFICKNGPIWIQGGSNAGGNVNRLNTTSGTPGNMQYNSSRRGTQIYSNGIAFADPYNGNSNNDAGWIRHIETSANNGILEIAVGDDGAEEIIARQYNTSNNVARQMYLLNGSGFTSVSNQSTDSSYMHAAMQIRETNFTGAGSDTWGQAPRLAWHWGGRVTAQIGLASSGWLYEAPNGTTFYRMVCETGTWGINITGRADIATYANYLSNAAHSVTLGTSGWGASNPWNAGNRTLIWGQYGKSSASSDTADIVLYYGTHANAGGAGYFLHLDGGVWSMCGIYTAVWNDFAEYRVSDVREAGYVVAPASDGKNYLTTERMQPGARIISDTFGQSVGYCDEARTPLGVSGRVLAYPARAREEYKIGDCVCASPGGKVDIMTREEIMMYPDRIIGIVNEIPDYDVWKRTVSEEGGGAKTHHLKTEVKGRIWIDIK